MAPETVQTEARTELTSELDSPIWAVISFERVEANALDRVSAERLLLDLDKKGVAGLCIVTDEAAARIKIPK